VPGYVVTLSRWKPSIIPMAESARNWPLTGSTEIMLAKGLAILRVSGGANVAALNGDLAVANVNLYVFISDAAIKPSAIAESGTVKLPLSRPAKLAGLVVVNV